MFLNQWFCDECSSGGEGGSDDTNGGGAETTNGGCGDSVSDGEVSGAICRFHVSPRKFQIFVLFRGFRHSSEQVLAIVVRINGSVNTGCIV